MTTKTAAQVVAEQEALRLAQQAAEILKLVRKLTGAFDDVYSDLLYACDKLKRGLNP